MLYGRLDESGSFQRAEEEHSNEDSNSSADGGVTKSASPTDVNESQSLVVNLVPPHTSSEQSDLVETSLSQPMQTPHLEISPTQSMQTTHTPTSEPNTQSSSQST